jgi:hypothetical protein
VDFVDFFDALERAGGFAMMIARARTFMFVSSAIERRKGVRTGVERRKVMGGGVVVVPSALAPAARLSYALFAALQSRQWLIFAMMLNLRDFIPALRRAPRRRRRNTKTRSRRP